MAAEEPDLRADVIVHTHRGDLHPKAVRGPDALVVGTIRTASRQDDSFAMKMIAALREQFGGHAVRKR
jgi:hypothetical protein